MRLLRLYRDQRHNDVLEGTVIALGIPPMTGEVLEIGHRETVLRLPSELPGLPLTHSVQVRYTSDRLKRPVVVGAAVEERHEDPDGKVMYRLVFDDPEELQKQLTPAANALFNRRSTLRVEPAAELEGWLECADVELRVNVPLLDISAGGIAVGVDAATEGALANSRIVRIIFHLPSTRPHRIDLVGCIVHRATRATPPAVRYGIQFDARRSTGLDVHLDRITDYVNLYAKGRA